MPAVKTILALTFLLSGAPACRTTSDIVSFDDDADVRVLFIGNSLTYVNDVPSLFEGVARRDGRAVSAAAFAIPDAALEDHWNRGVPDEIRRLRPDFVVMQQGPSSLPASRAHLVEWATRFAEVIREAGGEPALYMVWPDASRRFAFGEVERSYADAAAAVQGILLPAGTTWLELWAQDQSLELYASDNLHASYLGSVAAALTIYAGLFDVPAAQLPSSHPGIAAAVMTQLTTAVSASIAKWKEESPATDRREALQ